MKKKEFKEYIEKKRILADGSFGTYYAEVYQTEEAPELANVLHTNRVVHIHKSYLEAGARLLRTNTFASNTFFLNGNIEVVKRNIAAAIFLAETAVKEANLIDEVYIAGDIGPIPIEDSMRMSLVEQEYYEIGKTFIEAGITILNFETFAELDILLSTINRLKKEYPHITVMVSFSVNQFGYSSCGLSVKKLFSAANKERDIDIVGLNCGIGPAHMRQILERSGDLKKAWMVLPNAGYPKRIRNRITFGNNMEYFTEKLLEISEMGASILGGCCGTNPSFIQMVSDRLDLDRKEIEKKTTIADAQKIKVYHKGFLYNQKQNTSKKPIFYEQDKEKEFFTSVLANKYIAVELAPPMDANDEKILEAASSLKDVGVDVLTFPDSPSGRTRVDSVLMAEKVRQETGMEVMPHICCRDKNAIAMRSTFLGAHINDIYNMLIITGDPIPSMARQTTKAVFNFDSVGLMNIARDMNEDMFPDKPLSFGGAINQNRLRMDIETERIRRKMKAGAEFFLTQPVFSKENADKLREIKADTGARILCGIMPFVSRKNAEFMKNEIAGVVVSDEMIARYKENATKEEGEMVGISIAREVISYTADFADGYYFSFPFNRVHMLKKIFS